MIDSSVGGKTAINVPAGKNLIGAFYQPVDVYADLDLLKSLGKREIVEGTDALWGEIEAPYKHTIRAFLVHFHTQVRRRALSLLRSAGSIRSLGWL